MNTRQFNTEDDRYFITEYGNGWAYEVKCNETDYSFFVQDHEADDLCACTNKFEDTRLLAEYMEARGEPDRDLPTTEEEKWKEAFDNVKSQWENTPSF